MKKSIPVLFLFLSLLARSSAQDAATPRHSIHQGKVVFDISYPNSQLDEQTMSMMPGESILYFKEEKSRVEVSMSMGTTTVITDRKTGDGTMLMDMMGNKMAVRMNQDDIKKQQAERPKPVVKLTDESKVIAGYTCKKAVVTSAGKDGEMTFDVWFTKDLSARNSYSSQIEGIDGFMMEFTSFQNGLGMRMSARSVEEVEVDDAKFIVPDGYKKMTMDDLKHMQHGGK